jgi:hypothetical protein
MSLTWKLIRVIHPFPPPKKRNLFGLINFSSENDFTHLSQNWNKILDIHLSVPFNSFLKSTLLLKFQSSFNQIMISFPEETRKWDKLISCCCEAALILKCIHWYISITERKNPFSQFIIFGGLIGSCDFFQMI